MAGKFCNNFYDFRSKYTPLSSILGLQSFPRECEDKDMAAMLVDITKEANEKYFVNVLQHGGYDVTWTRRTPLLIVQLFLSFVQWF
jgi:hypothetical protein